MTTAPPPPAPRLSALAFAREVFPPALHAAYAAAWFFALLGSLVLVDAPGRPLAIDRPALAGIATLFLVLFYLRLVDEVKDLDYDRVHHPDRPLARGAVGVRELGALALGALVLVLALNAGLSWKLGAIAVADMAYAALLVRLEALSPRIRDGMFLNLIVTYPVNVALSVYTYIFFLERYGASPSPRGALVVLAFALAFLHYEIGRKTVWPHLARPGERLYSRTLGGGGAAALALGCAVAAVAIVIALHRPLAAPSAAGTAAGLLPVLALVPAGLGAARFLAARDRRRSMKGPATIFLLAFYLALILEAAIRSAAGAA